VQRYTASALAFILSSFLFACSSGRQGQPANGPGGEQSADPAFDAASWEGAYYGLDVVDANTAVAFGLPDKKHGSVVLRTTDGGARWVGVLRLAAPEDDEHYAEQDLAGLDFADAQNGGALTDAGGFFTTADGGTTWTPVPTKAFAHKPVATIGEDELDLLQDLFFLDETRGWSAGSRELADGSGRPVVYRTEDGGATWKEGKVDGKVPAVDLRRVFFVDAQNGWIVGGDTDDDLESGLLLRTTDGGATWTQVPVDTKQTLTDVFFVDAQRGWLVGATEDDASGGAGPSQILATDDGGATWRPQAKVPASLYAVRFADASHGWAVGSDWKIMRTTDGGATWSEQSVQERSAGQTLTARDLGRDSFFAFVLPKAGHGWAISDVGLAEYRK
jgi:photosystem II stability/assembly factor-like uncharacterized protein